MLYDNEKIAVLHIVFKYSNEISSNIIRQPPAAADFLYFLKVCCYVVRLLCL